MLFMETAYLGLLFYLLFAKDSIIYSLLGIDTVHGRRPSVDPNSIGMTIFLMWPMMWMIIDIMLLIIGIDGCTTAPKNDDRVAVLKEQCRWFYNGIRSGTKEPPADQATTTQIGLGNNI